jgi:hypothetical protein
MAAADNNVRPWRQASAATARRAPSSGLARLLLQLLELLHLDRKLLLLLTASLMPACIIPVGPEWQDPPGEMNVAPKIIDWTPFVGGDYAPVGGARFKITVADPNGDRLFFKWIANYTEPSLRRILSAEQNFLPPNGGEQRPVEEFFNCTDLNGLPATNDILVVVADRAFVETGDPIAVIDNGQTDVATWTLIFPCQMQ